jgi:hypothetical protein
MIIKINTKTHEETIIKRGLALEDAIKQANTLEFREIPYTTFNVRYEHLTD